MKPLLVFGAAIAAVGLTVSCARQSRSADAGPPSARQLLNLVLDSRDVPRTVDVTCASVGSQPTDRTLGDYIATLLTEYTRPEGRNWITTACKPAPANDTSGAAWHCEVIFHREHGEDSWERGLFFRLTGGQKVIANSYMCTGGG